jgi:hypothetical protein
MPVPSFDRGQSPVDKIGGSINVPLCLGDKTFGLPMYLSISSSVSRTLAIFFFLILEKLFPSPCHVNRT